MFIKCHNVHKTFGTGDAKVNALRGVNLSIEEGELRLLMGPSGSGKTTLISIMAGMLTQDEGSCLIANTDINHLSDEEKTNFRAKNIGFVFQAFNLVPMLTCKENVAIPLLLNNIPLEEALKEASFLLKEVGLADKIEAYPINLSGGQQQRVAIARAMIHKPKLIVCDEPTSHLDQESGFKIMALLRDLAHKEHSTLIVVTHDVRITQFASKIDYLEDGQLKEPH